MSDGNKSEHTGILTVGVVSLLLIIGLIGYFLGIDTNLELEHESRAQQERSHTAENIKRYCLGLDIFEKKCIEDEIEAYRSAYDGSEDLSAQKEMANWAKWLLVLTAFTSWVSLLAVVYVARTFGATSDTLDEVRNANQIMRDEQRPWVTLERELYCDFLENGRGCQIIWNKNFTNKGKSPAHNVRHNWKVIRCHRSANAAYLVREFVEETTSNPPFFHTPLIFPGETTDFQRNQSSGSFRYEEATISTEDEQFILITCITYEASVLGEDVFVEARAFKIVHKRGFGPFSTKMREYGWTRYIQ